MKSVIDPNILLGSASRSYRCRGAGESRSIPGNLLAEYDVALPLLCLCQASRKSSHHPLCLFACL